MNDMEESLESTQLAPSMEPVAKVQPIDEANESGAMPTALRGHGDRMPTQSRGHGTRFLSVITFLIVSTSTLNAEGAPQKIRLMIVDGQNNHDWRATTAYLR